MQAEPTGKSTRKEQVFLFHYHQEVAERQGYGPKLSKNEKIRYRQTRRDLRGLTSFRRITYWAFQSGPIPYLIVL